MEILLMVIGAIVSAFISWLITDNYHRKASSQLEQQITTLTTQLKDAVEELVQVSNYTAEKAELIEKYTVAGTFDDPEMPYK